MMKEKNNTSHEIKLLLAYRLTLASGRVPLQLQLASDDGIGWAVGRLVLLADAAATMAGCQLPRMAMAIGDGRCRRCHGDAARETETRAARLEACVRGS